MKHTCQKRVVFLKVEFIHHVLLIYNVNVPRHCLRRKDEEVLHLKEKTPFNTAPGVAAPWVILE